MRIRFEKNEEIKLHMTAMIDIVFQLLVFFIMTFKVVAMEGDFNVKMPLASESADQIDEVLPTIIRVSINAGAEGGINSIEVDNGAESENYDDENMYLNLTSFVEKTLTGEADPSTAQETEVEFDIDYALKYRFTVKAIEAVSGRVMDDQGNIKKLIEKIKFKDNTDGMGD